LLKGLKCRPLRRSRLPEMCISEVFNHPFKKRRKRKNQKATFFLATTILREVYLAITTPTLKEDCLAIVVPTTREDYLETAITLIITKEDFLATQIPTLIIIKEDFLAIQIPTLIITKEDFLATLP
jgi:hypothetical protein